MSLETLASIIKPVIRFSIKFLVPVVLIALLAACVKNFIPDSSIKELKIASFKTEAKLLAEFRDKYGKKKLEIINQQIDPTRVKAALLDGSIDVFIGELGFDKALDSEVIARDPIVVITNLANEINNLSQVNLNRILTRELRNWQSLGTKNYPIVVIDQSPESPTVSAIYKGLGLRSSNIVKGSVEAKLAVAKFPNAISYISFADLDDKVKAININNLPATKSNIDEGYYPLSREVKLYYNPDKIKLAKKKRSLKKFLAFVYNRGQDLVSDNGYMPLTEAERELIKIDSDPIYIGIAVPLEGAYLELAKSIVNAAKLAVEDINENDGINSRPVELIVCNDKASVAVAIECANKFVANEVQGVIGHLTSQTSIEASKIYAEHNIVQISPASTHPWFTERPGARGYTYRTIARDDKQAALIARLLDNLGFEQAIKVSIFNNGTIYGSTLSTLIENAILKRAKHKVVEIKDLKQAAGQYHKEIESLESDVLIFVGEYGDAAQIVKELALNAKGSIKFIGADGVFSPGFIHEAGLRAEGAYVTGSSLGQDSALLDEFTLRFDKQFKTAISSFALNSYDATSILLHAIKESYQNQTTVATEMHKTKYDGITGRISFDNLGDPNEERLSIYKVENGKFVKR